MRIVRAFLFLALVSASAAAQAFDEAHAAVRAAYDERRYADALREIRLVEQKHPAEFKANNYDYLAGRASEKAGDPTSAAGYFLAVIKRNSILKPYALYHLALIARSSGNLMLERTYLDELAAFSPDSLLAETASNRTARSWFESGNYDKAAAAFRTLAARPGKPPAKTDEPVARENKLLLGRSLLLLGNAAEARTVFLGLIGDLANTAQPDDLALAAAKALDAMDLDPAASQSSVPRLSDYEHLRRASIYQFNRDFDDARKHYAAIIRDHPTSGIVPDAIFQTGRGYVQDGNFSEAVKWFERTIEQFPDHPVSRDALAQAASAYARVGKHHEGVKRYQDLIAKYPGDERLDRAYLNIIDTLRDAGEETEALKWASKTQDAFRGKLGEALALFSEVRINLARSNWDAAQAGVDKLLTMPDLGSAAVPGGTTRAELTFLRGYAFEQNRNFAQAIETYLSIPDGRAEYYGWRATERLRSLAGNSDSKPAVDARLSLLDLTETKDPELRRRNLQTAIRLSGSGGERTRLLDSLGRVYSSSPVYRKLPAFRLVEFERGAGTRNVQPTNSLNSISPLAAELVFLGLFDEAAPELEAAQRSSPSQPNDLNYTIAVFNKRGDRAHRAVVFAEPAWRSVPADYQVELIPRDQLELLYPAPYAEAFHKHSLPRNVDPRFLLSIVRQESRYRPDIKSYAAARGMMQFISTTSDRIAAELGRANFEQDELYIPSTAILFGSQYVANLFKLFPDQPEAVAASYNGGEDNMKRWLKRSRSNAADAYVPEIAFSQTKDYVYRVMANYRIYRLFYDEKLNPAK